MENAHEWSLTQPEMTVRPPTATESAVLRDLLDHGTFALRRRSADARRTARMLHLGKCAEGIEARQEKQRL